MRNRSVILVLLLAATASSCAEWRERWPWRKKNVPVTPPSETGSPVLAQPVAVEPEQVEDSSTQLEPLQPPESAIPAPVQQGQATEQPRAPGSESGPGSQDDSRPPSVQVDPMMLENIVPDAEPIGAVVPVADPTVERESLQPVSRHGPPQPMGPVLVETELPSAPLMESTAVAADEVGGPPPGRGLKTPKARSLRGNIEYGKEETIAAPLLQVNGKFLTVEEVLAGAAHQLSDLPKSLGRVVFQRRAGSIVQAETQNQIIKTLVHTEAENRLTEQQKAYIDSQLDEKLRQMVAEVGGSRQKLEASLARQGKDLQAMLDRDRKDLMVQTFLSGRFYPAIAVTRSMLWDYYTSHASQFTTPKKVQMQIIAAPYGKFLPQGQLRPTSEERSQAAGRAREVIEGASAALASGEEFGQVAKRLSRGAKAPQGGVWPLMEMESFREKEVEEAAFSLAEGQVSDTIETDAGNYIVKAKKVQPGQIVSFEEAQERIDHSLRMQQTQKLEEEYFQRLLARAHVGLPDEFLSIAVAQAVETYWGR